MTRRRSDRSILAFCAFLTLTACGADDAGPVRADDDTDRIAVPAADTVPPEYAALAVLHRFGEGLGRVSLLAPEATVRRQLVAEFGSVVTEELLDEWIDDPARAPGRRTSSPWPARIEVREVSRRLGGAWRIDGDVIYASSADTGAATDAMREPIRALVVRSRDGSWRIAELSATGTASGD